MKLIQRLTLLSSIALFAAACDLQQTFDERIDDKQLLVLSPDFADTSVQLVFRDPETLAVIDEDFEVTVYANKRLVDLNGNYKNEFIARGGVMEFSVSPEETVSESDPLEFTIYALTDDQAKIVRYYDSSVKKKGFNNVSLIPNFIPELSEIQRISQGPKSFEQVTKSVEEPRLEISFNKRSHFGGQIGLETAGYQIWKFDKSRSSRSLQELSFLFLGTPEDSMTIEVKGPTFLTNYKVTLTFGDRQTRTIYRDTFDESGHYTRVGFIDEEAFNMIVFPDRQLMGNALTIPSTMILYSLDFDWFSINDYSICKNGFYIQFEGLESGDSASFLYRGIRDFDDKTFMLSTANISDANNTVYSLEYLDEHIIGTKGSHRIEFAENSQYIIEPSVIELGGEELCGNTYTVTLKRRDTHKMHNINLSMRNENQNVGVALTFSALLRKQGQSDAAWETVNFKQGSASVFLEEGSTYEVKLTLADEPFEFTFANDLSLVEAAVQATKRNVSRIKDITYTIEQTADSNTIDAEIVFFEGQSLID